MFLYKNLFFFNIFYSFNPNHAYWNQGRLFSGNLPGMFNFSVVFVCYIKLTINLGIIIMVINSTDQQFNESQISNLFHLKPTRWAFHKVCFGLYFGQLRKKKTTDWRNKFVELFLWIVSTTEFLTTPSG